MSHQLSAFARSASGLLPGAIEIMDALALEAASAAVHAEYPPGCEAVLIVELEGPREVVAAQRPQLDSLIAASGPVEARPARDAAERHLDAALPQVEGDYMGEHWLASFALLALIEG